MTPPSITTKHTFCRICEASCGLEVDVADGRIVDIRPNQSHIGTLGFACMKGLHQHRMYDSPDRLTSPLKKIDGEFQEISWAQANREIGQKVRALKADDPQSIGMYVGTAAGFSLLHPIFAEGFMQGVGSHNIYSSATQDCANKFAAAQEMYGFPFFQPFVDLDNVECLFLVGTNPVVSKWTFLQVAHPVKRLKAVKARGGRVIVIDPRKTETAKIAGEHQFIKPNADVYFFLSFLQEIFARGAVNETVVNQAMSGLDELKTLVQSWPPGQTENLTGISPLELRGLVDAYLAANGAAFVTGTGIGMGGHGTLAHWLAESINAVTGNLDRKGGTLIGEGIFDFPALAQKQGLFNREARSRIGGFRELNGGFPGGILADEITTPGEGQIRAMFVTGGNPLMTMANSARLKSALESLELLVVTDIYLNETASIADYVLPATSPLERYDLPFVFPLFLGMQSIPYLAATEPVVPPSGEQRDEATIYTDLATVSGVNLYDSAFLQWVFRGMKALNGMMGNSGLPQRFILDLILRLSGAPRFKALLDAPGGMLMPATPVGHFLGKKPLTPEHKVQLVTDALREELQALTPTGLPAERPYRLISKRVHATHNSWTQNIEELTHGDDVQTNYVYVHPQDAAALGVVDGDVVDVASETGTIRLPVRCLDTLTPGVVSVPHGWGHQGAAGLSVASRLGGANVNLLASDGLDHIEKISGMVHLTGIPVSIKLTNEPVNARAWDGIGAYG
jgi:anaerobic selenocysteine-containing dehydrogenase